MAGRPVRRAAALRVWAAGHCGRPTKRFGIVIIWQLQAPYHGDRVMAILEGLVILTIVLVGSWVGYAYWEEWTHGDDSYDAADPHDTRGDVALHDAGGPASAQYRTLAGMAARAG